MNRMRKFIFAIIVLVIGAMLFGAGWNLNRNQEHGFGDYRKELACRGVKIEKLEDSIAKLNCRLKSYEQLRDWFLAADSDEVDRAIRELWSNKEQLNDFLRKPCEDLDM